MRKVLVFCGFALGAGLIPSSCSNTDYQQVSYSGAIYYYSHGSYYRRYWYGYRPCPKPPGKPDRPIRPEHPIEKPGKPDRPSTQPVNQRPQTRPSTQPSTRPVTRPTTPSYRPAARPMPRARAR
ncbi:hypothetical protein [Haloferula sp.]|uniref:hypothetical protein n=1 Tax=Haloferula sp. TaxID=2497595 RepID=UPI00329DBD84